MSRADDPRLDFDSPEDAGVDAFLRAFRDCNWGVPIVGGT